MSTDEATKELLLILGEAALAQSYNLLVILRESAADKWTLFDGGTKKAARAAIPKVEAQCARIEGLIKSIRKDDKP